LFNNKNQIVAYAKWHSNDIMVFKSRTTLNTRYRKFEKSNHKELSKLINQFKSEDIQKEGKETSSLDTGFKVFKLDDTNIKAWDAYADVSNETLFSQESILKDGRTTQDLLYEILLKYGVFDKKVNTIKVNQKTMYRVGENSVIIDLNDAITLDDVRAIATLKPMTVIFYEDGFEDDNVKINAEVILKDHGVEDVRSI
jgi:adenine-specific DNA-methyltransferase